MRFTLQRPEVTPQSLRSLIAWTDTRGRGEPLTEALRVATRLLLDGRGVDIVVHPPQSEIPPPDSPNDAGVPEELRDKGKFSGRCFAPKCNNPARWLPIPKPWRDMGRYYCAECCDALHDN
jgi:hypothetical protein